MKINNTQYNQTFEAKLGSDAAYKLKKLNCFEDVSKKFADVGEPTTVIELMSSKTSKGKMYSLRLFNEVFGEQDSISILKDNNNKDLVSASPITLLKALADISQRAVELKEHRLFHNIAQEHSQSSPMIKYLKNKIKCHKENGKYLSPEIEQGYFQRFV